MKPVVVAIEVGQPTGRDARFTATTELGGQPLCCYGDTASEAARRAKGAALRCLGGLLERGAVELEEVRFKTRSA